jgi:predicted metal-dependent hydrolase
MIKRPAGVRVTYRRMKFDFESGFDRYWHSGSAFKSLFFTQLSTSFDVGERFFIDATRALKSLTDDPALLAELAEFCRQEGHHSAQHLKFDKLNAQMGIDVASCRQRYESILQRVRDRDDAHRMLAVTCALEHFTSASADLWLTRPELTAGGDPRVLALWRWHAAEEAEHRATCFDLYRATGGSYSERVVMMVVAWSVIVGISLANTFRLLQNDGQLYTWDTVRGLGYLFGRKGLISGLLPSFAAYFKPSFHPWSGLDGADIARWQADNERYIVNLEQVQAEQASASTALPTSRAGDADARSRSPRLARMPSMMPN